MKNQSVSLYSLIFVLFLCFSLGLFLGRNTPADWNALSAADSRIQTQIPRIDLNSADSGTLMTLPGIGEVLARRITDYRDLNGPFTSVAQLLNIEGIGQDTLEALLPYITAGG